VKFIIKTRADNQWPARREMLHAAGFQVKIADTPEKLVMLKGLAQRKIVPYHKEGDMYYLYADAASCQCLYMGTADAYQRYIEFKVGQSLWPQ
jgi:hypothetical protein